MNLKATFGTIIELNGRVWHSEIDPESHNLILFIQTSSGVIPCVFDPSIIKNLEVKRESVLHIKGLVTPSSLPKLATFEVTGQEIRVISQSQENFELYEAKSRSWRFLHVRKPEIKYLLQIKRFIRQLLTQFIEERGFIMVETPIISGFANVDQHPFQVVISRRSALAETDRFLVHKAQFYLEALAHSFDQVYTISPAFRKNERGSNLILSEFWMFEAEATNLSFKEVMDLVEDLLVYVAHGLVTKYSALLYNLTLYRLLASQPKPLVIKALPAEFWQSVEENYQKLKNFILTIKKPFPRVDFNQVLSLLKEKGEYFQEIHLFERRGQIITNKYKKPVFITYFPFEKRHFFDKKCPEKPLLTHTFDLIGHGGYGEIVTGGERECRPEVIEAQIKEKKLRKDHNDTLRWYHKFQTFASLPHSGFAIGLERLTAWLTCTERISDTIPFPRRIIGSQLSFV